MILSVTSRSKFFANVKFSLAKKMHFWHWILTQWIRQRSRDTVPLTTVKTEKQVTLYIYLFAVLGYDFSSTVSQTWLWNKRKIRIQAHVGFTATREMKPIINLLRESCILLLFVFMACLCGLLSKDNRFHHADERIFILFTTSPSIDDNTQFLSAIASDTFPWFLKVKQCLKPKTVLSVFLFLFYVFSFSLVL